MDCKTVHTFTIDFIYPNISLSPQSSALGPSSSSKYVLHKVRQESLLTQR